MSYIINFFNVIISRIIDILDMIHLPGSPSLLKYILSAIIIGFIIKLVKGSANEFDHSMNFSTGSIIKGVGARYHKNKERKQQVVKENKEV